MEKLKNAILKFFTTIFFPFYWLYVFFNTIFKRLFPQTTKTPLNDDVYRLDGGRKKSKHYLL